MASDALGQLDWFNSKPPVTEDVVDTQILVIQPQQLNLKGQNLSWEVPASPSLVTSPNLMLHLKLKIVQTVPSGGQEGLAVLPEHVSGLFSTLVVKLNDTVVQLNNNYGLQTMMRIRLLSSTAEKFILQQCQGLQFNDPAQADTVSDSVNKGLGKRYVWTKGGMLHELMMPIDVQFLCGRYLPFSTRIYVQLTNEPVCAPT